MTQQEPPIPEELRRKFQEGLSRVDRDVVAFRDQGAHRRSRRVRATSDFARQVLIQALGTVMGGALLVLYGYLSGLFTDIHLSADQLILAIGAPVVFIVAMVVPLRLPSVADEQREMRLWVLRNVFESSGISDEELRRLDEQLLQERLSQERSTGGDVDK